MGAFISPLKAILKKFSRDGNFASAAFLSYVSMLAMVPLIIVLLSLFSSFSTLMSVERGMIEMLLKFFVPTSAKEAVEYIKRFSHNSGALGIGGTFGLISLSYALFGSFEKVLNEIWMATKPRTFLGRILTFSNILFWLPFLLGTSFYITTKISRIAHLGGSLKLLLTLLPLFISTIGFSFSYLIIPSSKVEPKAAFVGGAVAAVLWEIAKHVFDMYTRLALSFKAFSTLYGPLIIFPVIMVWTYFSWLIVLLGAEVGFFMQYGKLKEPKDAVPDFVEAINVLIKIFKNFKEGGGPLSEEEIFKDSASFGGSLRNTIRVLEEKGIIVETENGFLPAKPPEKVSLSHLFQELSPNPTNGTIEKLLNDIKRSLEGKTLEDIIKEET